MNEHDDRWDESNRELVRIIRDEIEQNGSIRFDQFMQRALYHPEHGYYRASQVRPGREGDYITAPEAHPIFGATLAAQIVEFDALLGSPGSFTIFEYGAGAGRLIRPLLAEIRQKHPQFYERLTYHPVELNPTRLAELREHLDQGGHQERLRAERPKTPTTGCVIANEFLDAVPVRRFTRTNGQLMEAYVTWEDGWLADTQQLLNDSDALEYLERHRFEIDDGEWVEYHPSIRDWLQDVTNLLERGFVLLIDYGYPSSELFSAHRRLGTLTGYYRHGASREFYRGVGEQDLTAHVNLSEVEYQARHYGFDHRGTTTQAEFLTALGIGERLVTLQEHPQLSANDYLGIRAAVMRMIDPGAMGRFRVMVLGRGAPEDKQPLGLRAPSS